MRVSFMQKVDFWCGIPLCFMFSIWKSLVSLALPNKKKIPKKILFIELSEMGSAIIAHSSLMKTKADFPNAELFFLIFERNKESVEVLEILPKKNILVIKDRSLVEFFISITSFFIKARTLRIDTVIDMELFSRATALISYLCGASNRIGFYNWTTEGLYRGNFLTHKVVYNQHQHMALNFLSLVIALSVEDNDPPLLKQNVQPELLPLPKFSPADEEKLAIWNTLQTQNTSLRENSHIFILNPDPGLLTLRGWPLKNFAALARKLLEAYPSAFIAVVGLERTHWWADEIRALTGPERFVDLTGKTKSLRELMVLFELSTLLVTNDSGPAHVAALTGIRSLVLFGPETPSLYGPLGQNSVSLDAGYSCSPCFSAFNHRKSFCTDNKCMQAIQVYDVMDNIKRLLHDLPTQ